VAIVPFQAFANSSQSHGGIVERHFQCAQNPMHLVESAAPTGSSRLHCSMNFCEQKLMNNFNYCLQQHSHWHYVTVTSLSC